MLRTMCLSSRAMHCAERVLSESRPAMHLPPHQPPGVQAACRSSRCSLSARPSLPTPSSISATV
jgi:hypothetical protein